MRWIGIILMVGCTSVLAHAQSTQLDRKKVVAQAVLQQVGAAYGFDVLELPKLVVFPRKEGNRRIAKLELASVQQGVSSLDRSRLLIDEELLDICQAVDPGGAALAFVLSHEMAHFYRKHATFRNFAGLGQKAGLALPNDWSIRQEKEADETGLLFAYLAGYQAGPRLNTLFDRLYDNYRLNEQLPTHPSKTERQRAANLRTNEFRTYGYLFSVGHALYCREKFAEAARCFEYIYTRYPLKEAYNNFGTCRLQEALRLKKKTALSYFALPFEVDPRNRLLRLGERSPTTAIAVTGLLTEANTAFGRAIAMDNSYRTAYLNGAIGELLADNSFAALGMLQRLRQQTGAMFSPNSYLIEAIAYQTLGDRAKANASMSRPLTRKAYQFLYNQRVFQAVSQGTVQSLRQPWLTLRADQPPPAGLGCSAGRSAFQEVDKVPSVTKWAAQSLLELTNPPPHIVVSYGQAGPETYLRTILNRDTLWLRLKRQLYASSLFERIRLISYPKLVANLRQSDEL